MGTRAGRMRSLGVPTRSVLCLPRDAAHRSKFLPPHITIASACGTLLRSPRRRICLPDNAADTEECHDGA